MVVGNCPSQPAWGGPVVGLGGGGCSGERRGAGAGGGVIKTEFRFLCACGSEEVVECSGGAARAARQPARKRPVQKSSSV